MNTVIIIKGHYLECLAESSHTDQLHPTTEQKPSSSPAYLLKRGEYVDYTSCSWRVEPCEEVPEGDLVLGHEVVNHDLPLPESLKLHDKEAWIKEEIKDLLSSSLSCHLEATQGRQQLHSVHVTWLKIQTVWVEKVRCSYHFNFCEEPRKQKQTNLWLCKYGHTLYIE